MQKKPFYNIVNKGETATITINATIGDGYDWGNDKEMFSYLSFADEIAKLGDVKNLLIKIKTDGGSVFEGFAIVNAINGLKAKGVKVNTEAVGVVASMGVPIYLTGDERTAPKNTYFLIHDVSGGYYGTSKGMKEQADLMNKMREDICNFITERTNYSYNEVVEAMNGETWLNGVEAKEKGLITNFTQATDLTAKYTNTEIVNLRWSNPPINLIKNKTTEMGILNKSLLNGLNAFFGKQKEAVANSVIENKLEILTGIDKLINQINEAKEAEEAEEEKEKGKEADFISSLEVAELINNAKGETEEAFKKLAEEISKLTNTSEELTNQNRRLIKEVAQLKGEDPQQKNNDRSPGGNTDENNWINKFKQN